MAGSTNFLQHNPTSANQENDATYLADAIRNSGIGVDDVLPSDWLNKVWYQSSTFVAAFAQMMANKGYNMSDANITTLTNVLTNVFTSADLKANLLSVSYSPSAFFDASKSNGFQMTLNGNANTCTIGGWTPGQILTFILIQDATGSRTFNIPGVNNWQGINNPAPNSVNIIQLIGRADGSLWWLGQQLLVIPYVQNGTGIGQTGSGNIAKIGWSGTRLKATVDSTDLGNIVFDTQLNPVSTVANAVTTALAAFQASFTGTTASPGALNIPIAGGATLRLKWGNVAMPGSDGTSNPTAVTFPVAFPNACLAAFAVGFGPNDRITWVISNSASGMTVSNNGSGNSCNWFAIGF